MRRLLPCVLLLALALMGCSSGSGGGGGEQSNPDVDALTVQVTPDDAQIVLRASNGDLVDLLEDGKRIELDPGSYNVEIRKVRFHSQTQQVQVDGPTTLDVRLQGEDSVQPMPCGPLRVGRANPRYFEDRCGPIYLAGLHTWNNLNDMGTTSPPRVFDFGAFLSFLGTNGVNLTRLWAWETPNPNDSETPLRDFSAPQAWFRRGPKLASDGRPAFDLKVQDEAYFVRMRERVRAMQDAGIYVIVMLFEGWSVQFSPGGSTHPFGEQNNVNRIDHGGLLRIDTLDVNDIVDVQEAYVRKVVDTVNDLDNVLYEIANEAVPDSVQWQYHMIDFVKSYERSKPKQHPVGMTWPIGTQNSVLFNSPADWVSPLGEEPTLATGNKIVITDNDHTGGSQTGDQIWLWRRFTQGMNTLFMDCYVPPDGLCGFVYGPAAGIRRALGATRRYAERMDLASAVPSPGLASSGFCLASVDELAVFEPDGGPVTVTLPTRPKSFNAEWYELSTDQVYAAASVAGGASRDFTPPFSGPAVLFLWIPAP